MKRKMLLFALLMSMLITFIPVAAQASDGGDIWVRIVRQYERTNANTGEIVSFDIRFYVQFEEPPFLQDGEVYIPIREAAEALGYGVHLDREAQSITVTGAANEVIRTTYLDAALLIINGRTFVSMQFISENLGLYAHWNSGTKTVTFTTPVTQFTYTPSGIVWLARYGGEIYHSRNNCGVMVSEWATRTTRRAARSSGYRACQNCW